MKSFLLFFFIAYTTSSFGQSYQLLPDSCTFCLFKSSTGGNSWIDNQYGIHPNQDTLFLGNTYMKLTQPGPDAGQPFAFRQSGNQLKGIVHDSLHEFLIMDFDAAVGDTIYNLYSEGFYYHAKVVAIDSVLVNGGIYHTFMNLEGFKIFYNGWWQDYSWSITWNERALCQWDGGILYNVPSEFVSISISYAYLSFCTTDTLYTNPIGITCDNCIPQTNSLNDVEQLNFELFPNPTNAELHIETEFIISKIEIFNIQGELVKTGETKNISIDELPNGLYFVNVIFNGNKVAIKKVVKE